MCCRALGNTATRVSVQFERFVCVACSVYGPCFAVGLRVVYVRGCRRERTLSVFVMHAVRCLRVAVCFRVVSRISAPVKSCVCVVSVLHAIPCPLLLAFALFWVPHGQASKNMGRRLQARD